LRKSASGRIKKGDLETGREADSKEAAPEVGPGDEGEGRSGGSSIQTKPGKMG
jgi:hypothetical protein